MRCLILLTGLLAAAPAWAQYSSGALPPGALNNLPPGALSKVPPNAASMSPAEAKAQYEALSPDQKKAVKQAAEQAKQQYGNDPGMKEQLKAMYKSWKGGQ